MDVLYRDTASDSSRWKQAYVQSGALHTLIIVFLILAGGTITFFAKKKPNKGDAFFVKSAVKVDIVAMPKMTIKELKNLEISTQQENPDIEAEEIEDKSNSDLTFKTKGKEKDFLKRLKKLGLRKVKKNKKKPIKKVEKSDIDSSKIDNLILAGNKLSKGTATTGEMLDTDYGEFESYVSDLPSHIKPFWKLPSYLMDKELQCRVRIYLNSTGEVTGVEIFESSGEDEYDKRAVHAIEEASPFPAPPEGALNKLRNGNVVLGFPL